MINVGSATNSHPARTLVMGVVNVTPNSFSDGGMWADPEVAIRHARDLVVEGADIIDVGGESTRPGTERTPEHEELRRVLPVVKALVADGVAVSVDTMRASVAKAVVEAGATIVNDVSGGKAEPEILDVVADAGVDYVLMHWRGQSATMQNLVDYDDVVADVISETSQQVDAAIAAGIDRRRIIVDPGIGFSKTSEHNWQLMNAVDAFQEGFADLVSCGELVASASLVNFSPRTGRTVRPSNAMRAPWPCRLISPFITPGVCAPTKFGPTATPWRPLPAFSPDAVICALVGKVRLWRTGNLPP